MSMNATFVQVEALELARFQRDPSLAEALFQGGGVIPDAFLKLAQRLGKTPAEWTGQATKQSSSHPTLSLDKAWHGVHYLLCGETEPGRALLSQPVLGGTALGDDDEGFSGYGPARYFTAAEVAQLAQELNGPDLESETAARFDAERMSELQIYPGWETSDAQWVLDAFRRLRDFYTDAATNGRAIVTCIV